MIKHIGEWIVRYWRTMSKLRDEVSKIVDMRIPANGYKRYLYEIDRTGGFNMKVVLDMLIAMAQQIDELEGQLADKADIPFSEPTSTIDIHDYQIVPGKPKPTDFQCDICGKLFTSNIAVLGHKRGHKNATASS